MGDRTFLLADKLHINEKNFKSLLAYVSSRNVAIVRADGCGLPIDAFADYSAHRAAIAEARHCLESLSADALIERCHHGVNLFAVSRAELMSMLIAQPQWHQASLPASICDLVSRLLDRNRDELLACMAAAVVWIDYWKNTLGATPRLHYVGVFSGSLIYARTLLELMRYHPARCLVFESFFTGLHYYCEDRYQPIANRSDIRLPTVVRSLPAPATPAAFESKRNGVLKTIKEMRNKNVQQPDATGQRVFNNGRRTLTILGQVVNDFSVLELGNLGICSISLYRRLIDDVLANTDWNVVFKAHPWERKKAHLKRPLTKEELASKFSENERFAIVEDHALSDLFAEADAVACINSQSGIEAALAGFKPIQLGAAFWGGNGFSHDLGLHASDAAADLLRSGAGLRLSLDEYDRLEHWLVATIDRWLVEEAPGAAADRRLGEVFHEIAARKPVARSTTATLAAKAPATTTAMAAVADASDGARVAASQKRQVVWRKLRKLIRRPDQFFRDAHSSTVRRLGSMLYRRPA